MATIAGELGSLAALDGFVSRPGRPDVFFAPIDRVAIVSSDTTIGVAIPAFVFALCAKANVMVKDRDDHLVAAFAETIAAEHPQLGAAMRVETWDGSDDTMSRAQLAQAGTVVAYGRAETLESIRAQLAPEARFIPFGHRTSVGYIARETLGDAAAARASARALASDALLYDGEGCLSLHAGFIERSEPGATIGPAAFARLVADACDSVAIEFPAGYAELDPAARAYRRAAQFRAAQGSGAVYPGATGPHLVVLDPLRDDPPPFLRRTLALYAVDAPSDALAFVRRHALALEAVGIAHPARPDIQAFALASGAARIAPLGTLQRPPLGGEHGGFGRILPFVRAIYRQ